jgi:hypothetical protein
MKLEIRISATTVRTILLRAGLDPAPRRAGPTWTPVPEGHRRRGILATDFFTVETIRLKDDLRPVLHRALDPASARGRRHHAPRLGVGHLSKPGTSPSTSGFRVFGSSFATGTPSSPDRSMRCSAPRASGSFERRSAHLGRMHSRSGSFEDRAPRVPRPRPDLRSSAPRASAPGRTSRTTSRRDHIRD